MRDEEETDDNNCLLEISQRCIRNNGRRWRCRDRRVQDKMYCQKHINLQPMVKGKATKSTDVENVEVVEETGETHFTDGQEVEVTSVDEGFKDAWFSARIIKVLNMKTKKILVEYNTLLDEKKRSVRVRETSDPCMVRPLPPSLPKCSFHQFQIVDAYHNDGWWKGEIIEAFENSSYMVYFPSWKENRKFESDDLRVHQDWIGGKWFSPQELDDNTEKEDQGQQSRIVATAESIDIANESSKRKRESGQFSPKPNKLKKELMSTILSDIHPIAPGTFGEHLTPNCKAQNSTTVIDRGWSAGNLGNLCGAQVECLSYDELSEQNQRVENQTIVVLETAMLSEEDSQYKTPCREATNEVQMECISKGTELTVIEDAPPLSVFSGHSYSLAGVSPHNQLATQLDNAIEYGENVTDRPVFDDVAALEYGSLPFEKSYDMWGVLEKWDVFCSMPQNPHFQPLSEENNFLREGQAVGYMLSFAAMAEKISKLQYNEPNSTIEENLNALKGFEVMGFDVELIRSRLKKLLSIKAVLTQFAEELKQVEEKIIREKLEEEQVKLKANENYEKKGEFEEAIAKLNEKREILVMEKESKHSGIIAIQKSLLDVDEEICRVDIDFTRAARQPW